MPAIDPAKLKLRKSFKISGALYALAADTSASRLYVGGDDNTIQVFDLAAGKTETAAKWTKHENYVSAMVRVSAGGKELLVSGSYDRQLIAWDIASGQPVWSVEAHQGWVRDLTATPDGSRLVSVGDDMLVKVWDAASGKLLRSLEGHAKRTPQDHVTALYVVALSPDGKIIASGDRIGDVRLWELETGKPVQKFEVPVLYTYDEKQRKRSLGGIRSLAFSPDGATLAVGGMGQVGNVDGLAGPVTIELWDWARPARKAVGGVMGHKGYVNQMVFLPDRTWLMGAGGGGDNGFLSFWKIDSLPDLTKDPKATINAQRTKSDGHFRRLAVHPSGTEFYAAGFGKVEVWGVEG
jgi:WD40 repeat protein